MATPKPPAGAAAPEPARSPAPPVPTPTRTPAVAMLTTLLRSLQSYTDQQDTPRLLGTAASLLSTLTNPLNHTVLTAQLLTAPALWAHPDGLRTCHATVGVFHSAALGLARMESEQTMDRQMRASSAGIPLPGTPGGMCRQEWVKAVLEGAQERRWKSLLVLAGLISGFDAAAKQGLGKSSWLFLSWGQSAEILQQQLKNELVKAVNGVIAELDAARLGESLGERKKAELEMASHCLALVLNHVFQQLGIEKRRLNFDGLVPILISAAFFSSEGFRSAYFVGRIDSDVVEFPDGNLGWPQNSPSFEQITRMNSRPLIQSIGPVSAVISACIEAAYKPRTAHQSLERLLAFSKSLATQWRINRLSAIDPVDEKHALDDEALLQTVPALWGLLKKTLFSIIVILGAVASRMLADPVLASDMVAPVMASQIVHTLRNLSFLSSRFKVEGILQYKFPFFSAIDVLCAYPEQVEMLVRETQPLEPGNIPYLPLDRSLDLFFLNLAEHLTLSLSPQSIEQVVIAAATPYLLPGPKDGDVSSETSQRHKQQLMTLFEAAHSVMLSVFSASAAPDMPPSGPVTISRSEITSKYVPFYADTLFAAFPDSLSPRQFRLAFKTLMRVLTSQMFAPGLAAVSGGEVLAPVLLEILCTRAQEASSKLLPLPPDDALQSGASQRFSEKSTLVLGLIDAIPIIPPSMLGEWLPVAARLVNSFPAPSAARGPDDEFGPAASAMCKDHFWNTLVHGAGMDAQRAHVCMTWWLTRGGREMVIDGVVPPPLAARADLLEPMMDEIAGKPTWADEEEGERREGERPEGGAVGAVAPEELIAPEGEEDELVVMSGAAAPRTRQARL